MKPLTGRTHQIRVHLESIGHPILGDHFYGNDFKCQVTFNGHLLHARALTFKHPVSKENMVLKTEKSKRFLIAEQKIATKFLHLTYMNPLPQKFLEKFFGAIKKEKVLMVEQNYTAQCAALIREKIGYEIKDKFLKYDGRPFYPEEIVEKVKAL